MTGATPIPEPAVLVCYDEAFWCWATPDERPQQLRDHLATCVDYLGELGPLPPEVTAAQVLAALEPIRQGHRDAAADAKRYANKSGANLEHAKRQAERHTHHAARRDHASRLIRRFRAQARQENKESAGTR